MWGQDISEAEWDYPSVEDFKEGKREDSWYKRPTRFRCRKHKRFLTLSGFSDDGFAGFNCGFGTKDAHYIQKKYPRCKPEDLSVHDENSKMERWLFGRVQK